MVKMGQTDIRRIRYVPPSQTTGDIEVNTLAGIRERGGASEFLTTQRLDFDLMFWIEGGSARHTVDFADYRLDPGDLLWVRAGQVHRWGRIDQIEGPVVMFGPHTIDDRTRELIRSRAVHLQSHWARAEIRDSPVGTALDLLVASGRLADDRQELRLNALTHALAAVLVQLTLVRPAAGAPDASPTHEAYGWFRDHIEEQFRVWHKVGDYADRLGYSARTLNRLARQHTGLSAKQLIDERVVLEAKRRLSHGDASVAEVAQQLGFDDASNFSSYFRRHSGTTPGAFRGVSRGDVAPAVEPASSASPLPVRRR